LRSRQKGATETRILVVSKLDVHLLRREHMTTTTTTETTAQDTTQTTTDLEQFYTEVLKDPILQERLKSATDPDSLCELAVELGKAKGYSFTKEEALAAMAIEAAMGGEYVEVGEPLVEGPIARSSPRCGPSCQGY
jgi:hypothetical protein